MHFYPHNIGDFNNSTRHLTRVERSVYRDSIELYYNKEKPLTGDLEDLARKLLCRDEAEISALKVVLADFYTLEDGEYRHERCDLEIEKYRANTSAKARAGKASAESRKAKKANTKQHKATPVEHVLSRCGTHEQLNNKQEPLTINQELTNNKPLSSPDDPVSMIFDHWVSVMGKHQGQTKLTPKRAKTVRARLKDGYTIEQIATAITHCRSDPWSMGANDRGTPFNDLELICRTGEKLESFIEKEPANAAHRPTGNPAPTGRKPTPAERTAAKREAVRQRELAQQPSDLGVVAEDERNIWPPVGITARR